LHALVSSVAALFVAAATMHGRTRETQKKPTTKNGESQTSFV